MTAECILSLTSSKKIELSLRKNVCYRYTVCVCVCEREGKRAGVGLEDREERKTHTEVQWLAYERAVGSRWGGNVLGHVQLLLSWETDSWIEGHFYNNKISGKRETEIHREVETPRKTERLTVMSRRTPGKSLSKMFMKVSGLTATDPLTRQAQPGSACEAEASLSPHRRTDREGGEGRPAGC